VIAIGESVAIPPLGLEGLLTVPAGAAGLVLFAHGSGSSRHSPRNQRVAAALNGAAFGTLLFDLLTTSEADDRAMVFDTELLAERLVMATDWLRRRMDRMLPPLGYFGASTGAAAALIAAAAADSPVAAVVSRGGRPDLADRFLPMVRAPTLLIVGGDDHEVLVLNRRAKDRMTCRTHLTVIPGASHLFEEPGTLDDAIAAAIVWFREHLNSTGGRGRHVS
jgi:pimeloyl-ACP methyl ester carboxylesterase